MKLLRYRATLAVSFVLVLFLSYHITVVHPQLVQLATLRTILNDVWDRANHQLATQNWSWTAPTLAQTETEITIFNDVWDKTNHLIKTNGSGGGGGGAPTDSHYLTTQAESGLSAEFNLGGLTSGLLKHTVSGSVSTPATAVAGTDYVVPGGNVATATALAANGTNCSAGQFPLGVDASGASESCTALPTTITGTANQIAASAATGAITLSIPTNPTLPGTTTGTFSGGLTGNASTATALAANGANCTAGQFPLGVDAAGASENCTALPTTITGTTNQIAASASTGAIVLSIPTSPTLPGTTTGTFSGNITGNVTGNASTATALAANGSNCTAGQFPLGVDAAGASENCTALPTTITGTANQITASASTGAITLSIPSSPTLPGTTTGTFSGSLTGNASTATALAANGANCTVAGTFPNGVDASGVSENCVTLSAVNAQTTTYQVLAADFDSYKTITVASGTFTITLVASGSQPAAGKYITVINYGSGVVTIARSGQNINGGTASLTLPVSSATQPSKAFIVSDGTNYFAALSNLYTPALTETMTNKTLDVEATGNVVTMPSHIWFPAAGCNNATASANWDTPVSTPAVATCVTGTNIQKGVMAFADTSGGFSMQTTTALPAVWTTTNGVDVSLYWTTTATTGNAKWTVQFVCTDVAATATDDPAFPTSGNGFNTVTTAAAGTASRVQTSTITGATVPTSCVTATALLLHIRIFRDGNDAADTIAATANMIGMQLTIRRAL